MGFVPGLLTFPSCRFRVHNFRSHSIHDDRYPQALPVSASLRPAIVQRATKTHRLTHPPASKVGACHYQRGDKCIGAPTMV